MKYPLLFAAVFFSLLQACSPSRREVDLRGIDIPPVQIYRYDQALFEIPLDQLSEGLTTIKERFPFFLDTDLQDSAAIQQLYDYLTHIRTREFFAETQRQYPGRLSDLEQELTEAFRHIRYYSPDAVLPRVYTYISGGDYDHPIQFLDSVLLIAPDCYLGTGFAPYTADGLAMYKVRRMSREFILPDCMKAITSTWFPVRYPGNTFLDQMVDAGKRLYVIDAMIPGYPDHTKIGYTPEQMEWANRFESQVWAAIIEHQLLYTTRGTTIRSFMADGPFTADFTQESPPRLGEYIGWQIVDAFMQHHPGVTVQELIAQTDAQTILAESRYKPEK